MTFEDAIAELGLVPSATSPEVRRAYLRLVKTRKPEQDPEGFKRLREAFELAKGEVSFREKMHAARASAEEEAERSTREPAPGDREAPAEPGPAPPSPLEPAPEGAAPIVDETPPARGSPVLTSVEIGRLADDGKYKEAARAVIHALGEAETRPELHPPHEHFVLNLGFRLVENRSLNTAKKLEVAFQRWLEHAGPRSALSGVFIAVWSLFRDLVAVAERLSSPVRRAIAKTLRDPSLVASLDAAGEDDWDTVSKDLVLLRDEVPSLYNVVGTRLLAGTERGRNRSHANAAAVQHSRSVPRWAFTLPLFLLLTVIRIAGTGSCGSRSATPYSLPPNYSSPYSAADPTEATPLASKTRSATDMTILGVLSCGSSGTEGYDEACAADIDAVVTALRRDDCAAARRAFEKFRTTHSAKTSITSITQRASTSLEAACPNEDSEADGGAPIERMWSHLEILTTAATQAICAGTIPCVLDYGKVQTAVKARDCARLRLALRPLRTTTRIATGTAKENAEFIKRAEAVCLVVDAENDAGAPAPKQDGGARGGAKEPR